MNLGSRFRILAAEVVLPAGAVTELADPRFTYWNRRFGAETRITRVRMVRSLTVAALIEQPDPAGSVTDRAGKVQLAMLPLVLVRC